MQTISIAIYFEIRNKDVIIVPVLRHEAGFGITSKQYIKLSEGYTIEELSIAIMDSLEKSKENDLVHTGDAWKEASGKKSYPKFTKKYNVIRVCYLTEWDYYEVSKDRRFKDGSYGLEKEDLETRVKKYPGRPSVETIGEQVLEALKIE